jgi:hypothetical protein
MSVKRMAEAASISTALATTLCERFVSYGWDIPDIKSEHYIIGLIRNRELWDLHRATGKVTRADVRRISGTEQWVSVRDGHLSWGFDFPPIWDETISVAQRTSDQLMEVAKGEAMTLTQIATALDVPLGMARYKYDMARRIGLPLPPLARGRRQGVQPVEERGDGNTAAEIPMYPGLTVLKENEDCPGLRPGEKSYILK